MRNMSRLLWTLTFCFLATGGVAQAQNEAAGYPNKPVRLISAFAPGAATDLLARVVAERLTAQLGQPFVVENRTGANGTIATRAVLDAAPDGYTLLVGGSSPMVFNPITFTKLPYNGEDLATVTILGSYPMVIVARNDLPIKNIKEMLQLAKEKNGAMTYGSPAPAFQVNMEYINTKAGTKMRHVPYPGSGQAVQDVLVGTLDLAIADTTSTAGVVKEGKVRALAVTTKTRNPIMPDVPPVADSGLDVEASAFTAIGAHRRVPAAIILKLQQEVAKALKTPDVQAKLAQLGIEAGGMSPEESTARVKREIELYRPIAVAAGVKID